VRDRGGRRARGILSGRIMPKANTEPGLRSTERPKSPTMDRMIAATRKVLGKCLHDSIGVRTKPDIHGG
jgi:hypothetical protein